MMRIGRATDVGRVREHNEDSILTMAHDQRPVGLFIVADGLGGHSKGEVASQMLVHAFEKEFALLEDSLPNHGCNEMSTILMGANKAIYDYAEKNPECSGMGTTLTAALAIGPRLCIAQVGDSRAYIISGDRIRQITRDHSLVQELIDSGKITESEAGSYSRNVITRAVGIGADVDVDTYIEEVYRDDILLLCSDGLTTMLRNEEIMQEVNNHEPQDACDALVELANRRGGYDNISLVIVSFPELQGRDEVLAGKTVTPGEE